MTGTIKTSLQLFLDYIFSVFLSLAGLFLLPFLMDYVWGQVVYTLLFSAILFGKLYSRTHGVGKRDTGEKIQASYLKGLYMGLPLLVLNVLLVLFLYLLEENVLPFRDMVVDLQYSFPDNLPRVVTEITFYETLAPFYRVWFGPLLGLMADGVPKASLLFVVPVLCFLATTTGYIAGRKKFFISDCFVASTEKVKDKFNE